VGGIIGGFLLLAGALIWWISRQMRVRLSHQVGSPEDENASKMALQEGGSGKVPLRYLDCENIAGGRVSEIKS